MHTRKKVTDLFKSTFLIPFGFPSSEIGFLDQYTHRYTIALNGYMHLRVLHSDNTLIIEEDIDGIIPRSICMDTNASLVRQNRGRKDLWGDTAYWSDSIEIGTVRQHNSTIAMAPSCRSRWSGNHDPVSCVFEGHLLMPQRETNCTAIPCPGEKYFIESVSTHYLFSGLDMSVEHRIFSGFKGEIFS